MVWPGLPAGFGWVLVGLDEFGLVSLDLDTLGWVWLPLAGFGWVWLLDLGGFG